MKMSLLITFLFLSTSGWANGLGEKFCADSAQLYFQGYHQRVLDEMGVVQGYNEVISVDYFQKINDIDQRDETYHYEVIAENDEGDWWVWEYIVPVEAWLEAGGKAHTCTVGELQFLGVTEQSPN